MAEAHFLKDDSNSPGGAGPMTGDQADAIIDLLKELVELARPGAELSSRYLADQGPVEEPAPAPDPAPAKK